MTKTYKRVSLTYDFDDELTSKEAVTRLIDLVSDGEAMNYLVCDLPGADNYEWIQE